MDLTSSSKTSLDMLGRRAVWLHDLRKLGYLRLLRREEVAGLSAL
jgi:hypothetical protein